MRNPFEIKTPEQNTAEEIVSLFVDVFTDFYQVPEQNHTFINGPRGSGKSMMFRYILPDCQKLKNESEFNKLEYFSIYIPIKLTNINIVELDRLQNHANSVLNEHLLVTYVMSIVYKFIAETIDKELNQYTEQIVQYLESEFLNQVSYSGHIVDIIDFEGKSGLELFSMMANIMEKMHRECFFYCKKLALEKENKSYNGGLTDFIDFLYPLIKELKRMPFFPQDKPIYLLIDDAGYLNMEQTKVLNTWVSYRTTKDLCLKISTQLDYKTYVTTTGKRIDTPHDYSEINIATIYTTKRDDYYQRIKRIVEKRIEKYLEQKIDAETFFPVDVLQEKRIDEISEDINIKETNPNKKYAGPDAARRYGRSEFVKELNKGRSGMTYSYAGFNQLVAISSGIIRHFLAPAQEMFSQLQSRNNDLKIEYIPDSIQNEVISKYSESFLNDEFEKIFTDCHSDQLQLKKADKLRNLIDSLGRLFRAIYISDRKERVVFSVALTDRPDSELQEVIDLGIKYGYLHKSSKGNKDGTGRNDLYIISRVLSPYYKLNPLSFAGYQFMSSETLKVAITKPNEFVNSYLRKLEKPETEDELTLFD